MSDLTNLFKATVKTMKIREKSASNSSLDKSILPKSNKKSEFAQTAKTVVSLISKLKEFLLEHRKEYINASGFFGMVPSSMTDLERDQIDTEAEIFMKKCKEAIQQLKVQADSHKVMRQVREHKEGILNIVEHYLFVACQLYSEQKAIRIKRVVDKKRIARLQTEPILSVVKSQNKKPGGNSNLKNETETGNTNRNHSIASPEKSIPTTTYNNIEVDDNKGNYLSPEESMLLQLENEQIFSEMSTMVDEIKQVEGKIVEISRLQNIFAEKVLEQEKDIEKVADTVVRTTENIKEANEVIREAMKNNAGLRVWILFFLLVCTFSLLFLDWYNA